MVDASKFFYQFKTRPDDQAYLGLTHPETGEMLCWHSLPMGATASPGHAGKFGLAFLRKLKERMGYHTIAPRINCWWTGLRSGGYDPRLGHGYVLLDHQGAPAVRFWVHVDDFLIHAPTQAATCQALRLFLDLALDLGMLCHPKKLIPPAQVVKYTGFLFDTRGAPALRVPSSKRERALAMVQHLRTLPASTRVSALALSVVAGTLEALSDATPARLGHTYLRRLYDVIHPEGAPLGRDRYYTFASLPKEVQEDLAWWDAMLSGDVFNRAYPSKAGTLVPAYGDGSGTGTGGTINLPGTGFQLWMGQWSDRVGPRSSNWKELKTLLLVMQQIYHGPGRQQVADTTLFYFTDNEVTYYVCASGSSTSTGLHSLIIAIRNYEVLLGCKLQVVHIPGKMMIEQGTDGLSRGIWSSAHHKPVCQADFTTKLLGPAPRNPDHVWACAQALGLADRAWVESPWSDPLTGTALLHRFTVHYPPPELARQTIVSILEAWVESPSDTGALIIVPRVLSAFWHGLSKHLVELGTTPAATYSSACPTLIPVVTLALPPFFRPEHRAADTPDPPRPSAPNARRHRDLANKMRGL